MTVKDIVLATLNGEWLSVQEVVEKINNERKTFFEGREQTAYSQVSNALRNLELTGEVKRMKKQGERTFLYALKETQKVPFGVEEKVSPKQLVNSEILRLQNELNNARKMEVYWKNKYTSLESDFRTVADGVHRLSQLTQHTDATVLRAEERHSRLMLTRA